MEMIFNNKTKCNVLLDTDGKEIFIMPYSSAAFEAADRDAVALSIKQDIKSYSYNENETKIGELLVPNDFYVLVLKTDYELCNMNGKANIDITGEKSAISSNIFYDRFFISSSDATVKEKNNEVEGAEEIKKIFLKKHRLSSVFNFFILYDHLILVALLLDASLFLNFGIKTALICLLCAFFAMWLSFVIFNKLYNKLFDKLVFKIFKYKEGNEKKVFFSAIKSENINIYYNHPDMGIN